MVSLEHDKRTSTHILSPLSISCLSSCWGWASPPVMRLTTLLFLLFLSMKALMTGGVGGGVATVPSLREVLRKYLSLSLPLCVHMS